MKILDRYLTRKLLLGFLFALAAFVGLFVFVDLLAHRRPSILESEMPWITVAQYYTVMLPRMLAEYHFAGCAAMLATLFVVGTCAQRNELTAALAGGVPLFRLMRAPLAFGIAASFALVALSEFVAPGAARQALAIDREFFAGVGSTDTYRAPVSWANLTGGWSCHVTKFNRLALTGEEVLMLNVRGDTEEQIRAARMYWDDEQQAWIFEDGLWAVFYPNQGMAANMRRITHERAPIVETPEVLFAPLEDPALWTPESLRSMLQSAKARGVPSEPLAVEWHGRMARGAMPFFMVWIAIPLAARIRKSGRALSLAVAIGLWLAYFMLDGATQTLGLHGRLEPWVAVWLTNAIFGVIGTVLFRLTPR